VQKLSVIIPCYNEESNIAECLKSVSWADEVIAVDSFSTDDTARICRDLGARVLQHEYVSPSAQKNWAIPQASHVWALLLDADERVSDGLCEEIQGILRADGPLDGYWVKRQNYFVGKRIRFCGWQNDWVLRLFRRDLGRYGEERVHESLIVQGEVARCRHPLIHYPYRSVEDELVKIRRYGLWAAADKFEAGKRAGGWQLFFHSAYRFLNAYFFRGGFLDGKHGLVLCLFEAFGVFFKYAKLWEMGLEGKRSE